jgi:hypothetical protein
LHGKDLLDHNNYLGCFNLYASGMYLTSEIL